MHINALYAFILHKLIPNGSALLRCNSFVNPHVRKVRSGVTHKLRLVLHLFNI